MSDHYTSRFIQAMERVREAALTNAHEQQFVYEMLQLGWRERIQNLYRIKDKATGRFVFFQPNALQNLFLDERIGRDEVLKCRQVGFTTLSCVYAYDRALWDGWSTGIMSHLREKTGLLFEIIKNVNDWYKKDWGKFYLPVQEQDSANRISFSETKASLTVSYDFRGLTVRFLHASEAAFIETERLTGSMQSVPEGGEIILESTPAGCGGFFYNQWQLWKRDGECAPFKGHFFAWHKHYPEPEHLSKWEKVSIKLNPRELELKEQYGLEDYHLAWRRWKINESCDGNEEVFEREYPSDDVSCFLSGTDQVFPVKTLKLQESYVKDPSFVGVLKLEGKKKVDFLADKKGYLSVWELPKSGSVYAIGIDVATGASKDYSVAIVLNRNTGEQVAMLRGHIPLDDYAQALYNLGHFYNMAWMCPEINSYGLSVVNELQKMGYHKLFKRSEVTQNASSGYSREVGFYTSSNTKPKLIHDLVSACKTAKIRIRSKIILEEMSSFIQTSGKNNRGMKFEARTDCFDDCVMALAFANLMSMTIKDELSDSELVLPENMYYDEDTGFLMVSEMSEVGGYG